MRKVDENRAENYIKKHTGYKKWLAFALCLAVITGNVTLYMLNKPATAMTDEGAESVGLVLETADAEFEQELIDRVGNDEGEEIGEVVFEEAPKEEASNDEKEDAEDASEEGTLTEA